MARHLLVSVALVVGELYRFALDARELIERVTHPGLLGGVAELICGVGREIDYNLMAQLAVAARLFGTHTIDGASMGNGRSPAPCRTPIFLEARRVAPQLQVHILGHFFGERAIAYDTQDDPPNEALGCVEKLGEGGAVAATGGLEQ